MKPTIESLVSGIQCDAEGCSYQDGTVKSDDYEDWVDKPCPLCGANLLTEEDFNEVRMEIHMTKLLMENLSPDEAKSLLLHCYNQEQNVSTEYDDKEQTNAIR